VRNWRVITAVTTVVLAAAAALLTYGYLNNADQRAQDKVQQVPVFVAKANIPAGTSAQDAFAQGWIVKDKIPQKNVPDLAITGAQAVQGKFAVGTLDKGQVITNDSFVTRTQLGGTLASQLAKGDQAISFSVDQPHGVANMITAGDSINVILSLTNPNFDRPKSSTAVGATPSSHNLTAFLLPGLKVLAVGTSPATSTTTGASTQTAAANGPSTTTTPPNAPAQNLGLITVEVTARQAEQIAHAQSLNGTIYVSLNPTGFDAKKFKFPAEIVDAGNLFDQSLTQLDKIEAQAP